MHKKMILTLTAILIFVLAGCNLPAGNTDPGAIYTEAAKTLSLQMTQQSINTVIAQLTEISSGINQTPLPPTPTGTQAVQMPTQGAPLPTATVLTAIPPTPLPPTATTDPRLCNQAAFIRDVNVADGTSFTPGAEFSKIWRLRNVGYCTWDTSYSLLFVDGDRLQGDKRSPLKGTVRPGETIDVSVELIAPTAKGRYTGYWMLESDDGEVFGIGDRAKTAFWVEIRVLAPNSSYVYDFAVNMCSATWRSSAGSLDCPSDEPSNSGSIILLDRPTLENGRTEDEFTLWTKPQAVNSGWINGVYPPYKVKTSDHFLAQIGCLYDNKGCSVTFTLDYILPNGRIKNLGEWYEAYEGGSQIINVDLSGLAGQTVQFVLGVIAESKPDKANAFWLAPSIRQVLPPTPTKTPVTPTVAPPTVTPTATSSVATPGTEPLSAVLAARLKIAADTGIDVNQVEVISVNPVIWPDTCLGIVGGSEVCAPTLVPGYSILFQYLDAQYEAHTNLDGSIVYWFEL